jgi:putative ABC transport system substrate-binding protein
MVTNLAKPEGNITGISVDAGLEVWGKRLQFLRETVGKMTNVRLLMPDSWITVLERTHLPEAAQQAGVRIATAVIVGKLDREAYERVFETMQAESVDGLIVSDSTEHLTNRAVILGLAARHRLPAIYPFREFVDDGGLLSYGVDSADVFRRLADMTDQILRGAKPSDIPYYQQTKFELVLNRTAARSLGLDFPASLLAVADQVIE